MKLRSSVLALVIGLAGFGPAPHVVDAEERSFLWRATSGERSVYLLGSIHFMKKDAYPLSPSIERAYDRAGLLVFETDIDQLGTAAMSLLAAGTLDGEATLADVVPAELYSKVSDRLDAAGMSIAMFDKMKPWMVALSMTSFELIRAGYLGSEGIDSYFSSRAKADGKPQRGLETIEYQVSLFADLKPDEGLDFLRYTLIELDTMIPLVNDVVGSWESGDSSRMEELLVDGFEEHGALFEKLVTKRNLQWLPTIEALFEGDGDAMVIVGSLHLVGEQGLIELLDAKGYEIEQL